MSLRAATGFKRISESRVQLLHSPGCKRQVFRVEIIAKPTGFAGGIFEPQMIYDRSAFVHHASTVSTERIHQAVVDMASAYATGAPLKHHLDVGAGGGRLIELFRGKFGTESSACDYTDQLMKLPGQKVDIVNLNNQKLPYQDASFDIVTATEVVEHLENHRDVLRELHRVLKPGGISILTTPNILNLNSRLRFLWFGYWNLFGPLPVKNSALYSTGGHINPISYFYLAHSLMDAGFAEVKLRVDRLQRSALPKLLFWYVPIRLFGAWAWQREVRRFKTIDEANAPLVKAINSVPMLLGRTIVVAAAKPKT